MLQFWRFAFRPKSCQLSTNSIWLPKIRFDQGLNFKICILTIMNSLWAWFIWIMTCTVRVWFYVTIKQWNQNWGFMFPPNIIQDPIILKMQQWLLFIYKSYKFFARYTRFIISQWWIKIFLLLAISTTSTIS